MAATLTSRGVAQEVGATDDPFHDPLMLGIAIVVLIVTVAILALTGLFYWGVEHHIPSWSSHSFPPPVVY
jgi:hypothetical protein